MKIYTRRGDDGTTGLLGGKRVPKHHGRIEAYGNIDELNSYIGLIADLLPGTTHKSLLREIQDRLFVIGSHLALDPTHEGKMSLPEIAEGDVAKLELAMDEMDGILPEMKHFVLPGGHPTVSHCHIARCVCRRAERSLTYLNELEPVSGVILHYINRLSDYLFVLARMVALESGTEEIPWKPRG
jgi:cob(I)alamin adenosyltransferase